MPGPLPLTRDQKIALLQSTENIPQPQSAPGVISGLSREEKIAKLKAIDQGQSAPVPAQDDGVVNAAIEGVGHGIPVLGSYLDNFSAGATKLAAKGYDALHGTHISDALGDYSKIRDDNDRETQAIKSQHPYAFGAGAAGGALASGNVLGAAGLLPEAAQATGLGRIATAGGLGAINGALQNPGDVEGGANGLQLPERAQNAAIQGAGGLAIGAGAEGLKAAAPYLKRLASEKAVAALGATKQQIKNLFSKDEIQDLGQTLLNNKIVTPLASAHNIADRLGSQIETGESNLGSAIQNSQSAISEAAKNPENAELLAKAHFDPTDLASHLKEQIRKDYGGVPYDKIKPALDEVDNWLSTQNGPTRLEDVQQLKVSMNKFLKDSDFYRDPSITKAGTLAVRQGLKQNIESQGDAAAQVLGQQGNQIRDINRNLGQLYQADKINTGGLARDVANRSIGLTDTIAGTAGGVAAAAAGGGPLAIPAAIASAGINKIGRTYGSSLMATGANALSDVADKGVDPSRIANLLSSYRQAKGNLSPQSMPGQNINPDLLRALKEDPRRLDSIQNPVVKEQLKKMIDRNPSAEEDSKGPGHQSDRFVPEDEAKEEFLKGN